MKFGQYLVEHDIVDEETMIQALNIQRRRNLIPLGEIALQKHLLNSKELFAILNHQDVSGGKFRDAALDLGYLNQEQITLLVKLQETIHCTIGSILVELHKVDQTEIDAAWEGHSSESSSGQVQISSPEKEPTTEDNIDEMVKIFTYINQPCPVCQQASKQKMINPTICIKSKHDVDLKPSEYNWTVEPPQTVNPLLYEIWTCSECGFVANHRYFKKPTRELSMSPLNFAKKFKKVWEDNPELIEMRKSICDGTDNYTRAITDLLSAIHTFSQVRAIADKDSLPLANHCHHLAWLFRDLDTLGMNSPEHAEIKQLIEEFKKINNDLPGTEHEALLKALSYY